MFKTLTLFHASVICLFKPSSFFLASFSAVSKQNSASFLDSSISASSLSIFLFCLFFSVSLESSFRYLFVAILAEIINNIINNAANINNITISALLFEDFSEAVGLSSFTVEVN